MRNTSIFDKKPIQSSLSVCTSFCALLTITSKPHSINAFSLSMIRTLLFAESSFIASTFSSKLHLRLWEFPFAKSFEECICQTAVADPIKRRSSLRYFCRNYYCYQYFNGL